MKTSFEIIEHTADIGIRAFGQDLPLTFTAAATGMFSLITDLRRVRSTTKRIITARSEDTQSLLVEWLNQLLYLFDTQYFLCKRCLITEFSDTCLKAECWGETIDKNRHQLKRGIKSATYHMLKIEPLKEGGYIAEVLLDI